MQVSQTCIFASTWARSREIVLRPNLFDCVKVECQMVQFHKITNQCAQQSARTFSNPTVTSKTYGVDAVFFTVVVRCVLILTFIKVTIHFVLQRLDRLHQQRFTPRWAVVYVLWRSSLRAANWMYLLKIHTTSLRADVS